jgi:predicted nucleotidyltransferase
METVIKKTRAVGTSAGVLLPRSWLNKQVVVTLSVISKEEIASDVLKILADKNFLKNTMGIFLAGSYARGEETGSSDIDLLIITDSINKQIKIDRYEIILVSKSRLDKLIKNSIYLASLINEAKPILNSDILNFYKEKLKNLSIKKPLSEIKSMMKINEKMIDLDEELGEKVSDETLYSLVLRLRELYLMDVLINKKTPSNKVFLNLIKGISSEDSYEAYLRIKNSSNSKMVVSVDEAKSLVNEIKKRLKNLEHDKKK